MLDVIAYDIDGTLTNTNVIETYKQLPTWVDKGIITRRPPSLRDKFIQTNGLKTDFRRSSFFKTIGLRSVGRQYSGEKLYIGNRISDSVYTSLASWQFQSSHTVGQYLEQE